MKWISNRTRVSLIKASTVDPTSPGLNQPNSYNWGWREYGNRVGGWRLLELFEEFGLPLSVLLNTACYDHCPRQCHQPLAR